MREPEATLVTGGSNGIGAAIVQSRLKKDETVINLDRVAPDDQCGGVYFETDLGDLPALKATLEDVVSKHSVTRVVNCAGIAALSPLTELNEGDFSRTMEINVLAPSLIVKAAVPAMIHAGFGRVVNVSSRSALGRGLRTSYAASKGALISATRVWALELGEHGITVNAIGPGPIETELYRAANPPDSDVTKQVVASVPVKRLGKPEDVASAADYFLSRESGFVTGQTLFVCGGLTIGGVAV
ncbi:SDR family oxidoreductase [Hoeflea prorocentri]|uniref:SDR family oxidoreductase n=1 Tax=Hoeflea prorocentri TaxID=1922333 RepID=A0A9X3ZFZ5_9HYPH|nr:SDR family oxidoreductase [Hoeflea prorocentri]MCY6379392.1 SDR family oxidoreductase [Hoeflea prorocentri]MDA5397193.1 SDR family oxidoreductase [Hoeflea prorocentri]